MTTLILIALALAVVSVLALLPALLGKTTVKMESMRARNIAIAKERLIEIESAYDVGDISAVQLEAERKELAATLADDLEVAEITTPRSAQKSAPILATALIFLIPIGAVAAYWASGHRGVPDTSPVQDEQMASLALEDLISGLEAKVSADPNQAEGVYLLANTYMRLGRFRESANTFKHLRTLTDDDADTLSTYADALVMANDQNFNAESRDLLDTAIQLEPNHIKSLWLGGMAHLQTDSPEQALTYFSRLKPLIKDDPESLQTIKPMIEKARTLLGEERADAIIAANTNADEPINSGASAITVNVVLSPSLLGQVSPDDVLFVFARAKEGPPMPLAAARKTVADLPLQVMLDDSMAMLPQMALSQFSDVVVSARISKSGQPTAQPGDLQSELVETTTSGAEAIDLIISNIVP